ncbi:hypothetical protein Plhal304r1_c057g0142571 [Plasmopara halstedii]
MRIRLLLIASVCLFAKCHIAFGMVNRNLRATLDSAEDLQTHTSTSTNAEKGKFDEERSQASKKAVNVVKENLSSFSSISFFDGAFGKTPRISSVS